MSDSTKKWILFLTGCALLACGCILWIMGAPSQGTALGFYAACWRVGPAVMMTWLAYDTLIRMPTWTLIAFPILLAAVIIRPGLLKILLPLAVLAAILNYPLRKKRR